MLPAPCILKLIIDDALPQKDFRLLAQLLAAFTALFVVRAWLTLVRNRVDRLGGHLSPCAQLRLMRDLAWTPLQKEAIQ